MFIKKITKDFAEIREENETLNNDLKHLYNKMKGSEVSIETVLIEKDREIDKLTDDIKVYEMEINQLKYNIEDISIECKTALAHKDEEIEALKEQYNRTVKEVL